MAIELDIQKNFKGFSLDVRLKGQDGPIGILGASGSGKSMTLRSIAGIETPDSGRIIINGKTVFDSEEKINLKPQKRNVGYLFQNYALIENETIEQNLKMILKKDQYSLIPEVLKQVGIETPITQKIYKLSGGQQQRIALARLLLHDTKIILCDEPTGNLDKENRDIVFDILYKLSRKGKIVIMVTHDLELASKCDEEIKL